MKHYGAKTGYILGATREEIRARSLEILAGERWKDFRVRRWCFKFRVRKGGRQVPAW